MLKELLKGNIVLKEKVSNWQEAIKIASQKLLENGYIEEKYIEKMIDNINKLGPYIILSDDVAMPHSRPEDGVKKTGMGLLKLERGITFGDEDTKVRLIFILGAKNSNLHVDMITELVDMLQDEDKLNKILTSKTEEELIKNI